MVTVQRLQTDPAKADWWTEYHQYFIDDLTDQGLVEGAGTREEVTTGSGLKGQRVKFGPVTTEEVSGNLEIITFRLPGHAEAMLLQIYQVVPDEDHPDPGPAVAAAVASVRQMPAAQPADQGDAP